MSGGRISRHMAKLAVALILAGNLAAGLFGLAALFQAQADPGQVPVVAMLLKASGVSGEALSPDHISMPVDSLQTLDFRSERLSGAAPRASEPVRGNIDEVVLPSDSPGSIRGWAIAPDPPYRPLMVLAVLDDRVVAHARANISRGDIVAAFGSKRYEWSGFAMALPAMSREDACRLEVIYLMPGFEFANGTLPDVGCN